jgi:predicted ester cyclase
MTLELNEMVSDGDKVVVRWTVRGVQSGEFMGVPPTGKPIELTGINIYQIATGRIVANHEQTNVLEALRQLQ